jgi:ribosome-binding factor A
MPAGTRPERVAEEFREILAEEIPRLKDPRVGFLTVTHVQVSADLRKATVYYTVLGENRDHARTRAGLRSARTHLRSVLGHQVRMKFTPDLEFREDAGLSQVERVGELLREIGAPGGPDPVEGAAPVDDGGGADEDDEGGADDGDG